MRFLSRLGSGSVAFALSLAVACSGGAPADDALDGSGGQSTDEDGSSGGSASSTGGSESDGSGGGASGGEASGGRSSGGGGEDGGSGGLGGDGSGGSPSECTSGDTRPGTASCGLNGRGTLVQSCASGVWTNTSVCTDGEECTDDAAQTLTNVCGFNDRGDIEQTCSAGFWSGSDCDDPDECEDDDEQTLTDVCGLNDRGDTQQVCVLGLWEGSACDDPDECEDGDTNTESCMGGSGETEVSCVTGSWQEGPCALSVYRASVSSAGVEGNGSSTNPSLSADGRYVAFESLASNLVEDDDNAASDIFVHDIETGETRRVSLGSIVGEDSYLPSISGDGRHVAFYSQATDLVVGDNNSAWDVFVADLQTNTTTRVSVTSLGGEVAGGGSHPRMSADGRYVSFLSLSSALTPPDTNSSYDGFLHDRTMATTTRVSVSLTGTEASAYSDTVDISPDGTRLAFGSGAINLLGAGIDTNGFEDVFVRSPTDHTTITRASVNTSEVQADGSSQHPVLSLDGRYVVFQSSATNLEPNDTNGYYDIFLRDLSAGTTEIISVSESGSPANSYSQFPAISGDGRYVAFQSLASNLVPDDSDALFDVFVRDRQTGTVRRFPGGAATLGTYLNRLDISTDGRFVAYPADSSTLVEDDDNGMRDVFVVPLEQ